MLLSIAIVIQLRKNSRKGKEGLAPIPAAKIEDVELETDQPPVEQQPELDPIGKYLQHLDEICESVEPLGHNECRLKLSDWSLRYTMELASKTRYYDEPEEERPVATMYFTLHNDHSWEINDRGETAATLAEISENAEAEMDAFRRQISKGTIALSSDGTLRSKGVNYNTFEASLLRMRESIKSMDDRWSEQVWGKVGPMPLTIDKATGKRLEFSGRGFEEKGAAATQVTRSFSLVPGAMTYYFEREPYPLSKDQLSKDQPGTVCLLRDNPGILDDEMLLGEFTGSQGLTGTHVVAEGLWRDPHPGINYHLEIATTAKWKFTILQPELGQSKGTFPHRAGLSKGAIVIGPFRTGPRPVRAEIDHGGNGEFSLQFTSVDGTHQTEAFTAQAQFHIEDLETGLFPGKEYIACAAGNGPWEIKLSEGY